MTDWRPAASLDTLKARAELLATVRQFFARRHVLEVETPLLTPTTGTDVYIQSFLVRESTASTHSPLYLQTSPEFAMKRLLAAGSGPIYQLCKAFRAEEASARHNAEFTMLEWYRPGFTLTDLMDEVEALVQEVLDCGSIERLSYRDLFVQYLEFDPHTIDYAQLRELSRARITFNSDDLTRTDYLQMLLATCIEPQMPQRCFVYDYPIEQAALATISPDDSGQAVAKRFELFVQGMELANGYQELTDAAEQRTRFLSDNARRAQLGIQPVPVDERLLAAMAHGLPDCAGVALGFDRLLMAQLGAADITRVLSFPTELSR